MIKTICNSNMFQPLKGHLQGVYFIHSSSMGQQNESPDVQFNLARSMRCVPQR